MTAATSNLVVRGVNFGSEELLRKFTALATFRGMSRSALIRELVGKLLAEYDVNSGGST